MTMKPIEFQVAQIAYGNSAAVYLLFKSYGANEAVFDYIFFDEEDSIFTKASLVPPNITDPLSQRPGMDNPISTPAGAPFTTDQTVPAASSPAAPSPAAPQPAAGPRPDAPPSVGVTGAPVGSMMDTARQRRYASTRGEQVPTKDKNMFGGKPWPWQYEYQLPEDDPKMPGAKVKPGMGDRAGKTMAAVAGGTLNAVTGLPRKVGDWAKNLHQEAKDYSRHKKDSRALTSMIMGLKPHETDDFKRIMATTQAIRGAGKGGSEGRAEGAQLSPDQRDILEQALRTRIAPSRVNSTEFHGLPDDQQRMVSAYDELINNPATSEENRRLALDKISDIHRDFYGDDEYPGTEENLEDSDGFEEREDEGRAYSDGADGSTDPATGTTVQEIVEAQNKNTSVTNDTGGEVTDDNSEQATQGSEIDEPEDLGQDFDEVPEEEEEELADLFDFGYPKFSARPGVGEEGDDDFDAGFEEMGLHHGANPARTYDIKSARDEGADRRQLFPYRLGMQSNINRRQLRGQGANKENFSSKYEGMQRTHQGHMLEGMRDPETGGVFSMTDDGQLDLAGTEKRYNEMKDNYMKYLKSRGVDETSMAGVKIPGFKTFLNSIARMGDRPTRHQEAWEYDPLTGGQSQRADFPDVEGHEGYDVGHVDSALYDLLPNIHGLGDKTIPGSNRDAFREQRIAQGYDVRAKGKGKSGVVTPSPKTNEETKDLEDSSIWDNTGGEETPSLVGEDVLDEQYSGPTQPGEASVEEEADLAVERMFNEGYSSLSQLIGPEAMDKLFHEDSKPGQFLDTLQDLYLDDDSDTEGVHAMADTVMSDTLVRLNDKLASGEFTDAQKAKMFKEAKQEMTDRAKSVHKYLTALHQSGKDLGKSQNPLDRAFDTFFKEEW